MVIGMVLDYTRVRRGYLTTRGALPHKAPGGEEESNAGGPREENGKKPAGKYF